MEYEREREESKISFRLSAWGNQRMEFPLTEMRRLVWSFEGKIRNSVLGFGFFRRPRNKDAKMAVKHMSQKFRREI